MKRCWDDGGYVKEAIVVSKFETKTINDIYSKYFDCDGKRKVELKQVKDDTYLTPDDIVEIHVAGENKPCLELYWAETGTLFSNDLECESTVYGMYGGVSNEDAKISFTQLQIEYLHRNMKDEYLDKVVVNLDYKSCLEKIKNLSWGFSLQFEDLVFRIHRVGKRSIPFTLRNYSAYKGLFEVKINAMCGLWIPFNDMVYAFHRNYQFLNPILKKNVEVTQFNYKNKVLDEFCSKCFKLPIGITGLNKAQIDLVLNVRKEFEEHGVYFYLMEDVDGLANSFYISHKRIASRIKVRKCIDINSGREVKIKAGVVDSLD